MNHRKSEATFVTSEGLSVEVYWVQAEDAPYLIDLFEHLSANSRYMRFNQYLEGVDPAAVQREAELIALIDPAKGLSLLAFADLPEQPDAPVAAARYVRTDQPNQAEVAISVRDDMQHQGIGAQMLLYLAATARRDGIHTLVGTFHTSNRRVWALLAEAPYPSTTAINGFQTTVTVDLQSSRQAPETNGSAPLDIQPAR